MSRYYPAFLDLQGKQAVVIGGGPVAARKVNSLLPTGAQVTVISPDLTPELARLSERRSVEVLRRGYTPGDLRGAYLAVIATDDPDLNRQAAVEARAEGVLVNTVDDVAYCDFIAPAVVQQGDITLAVSTNGKSPAMARFLREQLELFLSPDYGDLLEVLEKVRKELRRRKVRVPAERWQKHIGDGLRELVRAGRLAEAEQQLLDDLTSDASTASRR